jgi:hypothetical protein
MMKKRAPRRRWQRMTAMTLGACTIMGIAMLAVRGRKAS